MSDPKLPSPPAPTVWPTVSFTDVDAGVRFLTEGLGFVVTAMHRSDDGTVRHAEARWPDGGVVMFSARIRSGPWAELQAQGIYVAAADAATVDEVFTRVKDMPGVELLKPVHDTDYGSHQFDLRDADGNLWTMGTYRGT